ncbi:MAG: cell division protein FtsQ/DivIB [Betaproteobacteria bacterium]
MNALAVTLVVITMLGLAVAGVTWVVRQPAFELREVTVMSPLARTNAAHLEAVIRDDLVGTFFTMDLARARNALRQVPWVRDVALRRQWPHRLEVTVDEHEPLARWNDTALVSTRGEVFAARADEDLPLFEGPDGRAADMLARYQAWGSDLKPLGLTIREIRMTPRGGWRLKTTGAAGALTVELGRDEPEARLTRFVAAHARTLGALARAGTVVDTVDLRYRNGFAARIPAFREKNSRPAA